MACFWWAGGGGGSRYNFDNELRGTTTDASWAYLKGYAEPWVEFLSKFADALHGKGKTLSVDLAVRPA